MLKKWNWNIAEYFKRFSTFFFFKAYHQIVCGDILNNSTPKHVGGQTRWNKQILRVNLVEVSCDETLASSIKQSTLAKRDEQQREKRTQVWATRAKTQTRGPQRGQKEQNYVLEPPTSCNQLVLSLPIYSQHFHFVLVKLKKHNTTPTLGKERKKKKKPLNLVTLLIN
jgi:hypothetical protein